MNYFDIDFQINLIEKQQSKLNKKNNTVTKEDIELKKSLDILLKYLDDQTSSKKKQQKKRISELLSIITI